MPLGGNDAPKPPDRFRNFGCPVSIRDCGSEIGWPNSNIAKIVAPLSAKSCLSPDRTVRPVILRKLAMNTFIKLITATAIVLAAAPTHAEQSQSIRIVTRDIDLATVKGQKMLRLRVARAAHELCDVTNERFGVTVRISQRQCREAAIASALGTASPSTRVAVR
jgi:UrcA family protein